MNTRRLAQSDGFALVLVMGVIAIITAVSITGYAVASQTLHNSSRVGNQNLAYQAASTGLEQEVAFFDPQRIGEYPKTVSLNATDRYVVDVVEIGGGVYEMRSTGTSSGQNELVLTRFQYLNLWDMNLSGGQGAAFGGSSGFNGSSTIIGPLYVTGNIEWTSNGRMWGGPVFLRDGVWNDSGNGQVGDAVNRVPAYGPVPSDGSRYFTDLKGAAPELNFDDFKLAANSWENYRTFAERTATRIPRGSVPTATDPANQSAAFYTCFDGDTTFNGDFGDPVTDAVAVQGNTLYIADGAVVYVDGTITFGNNIQRYSGNGVIFAREGIIVRGQLIPAGGVTTPPSELYGYNAQPVPQMTTDDLLGLLTLGDITFDPAVGGWLVGALFSNGEFHTMKQCNVRGAVICGQITIDMPNSFLCTQDGLSSLFAEPSTYPSLTGFTAQSDWIRR